MALKKGDIVKVKGWNELVREYGTMFYEEKPLFVNDMKEFCGKKYKVTTIITYTILTYITLDYINKHHEKREYNKDKGHIRVYGWDEKWLKKVSNNNLFDIDDGLFNI